MRLHWALVRLNEGFKTMVGHWQPLLTQAPLDILMKDAGNKCLVWDPS